jgi:hypothetical protein
LVGVLGASETDVGVGLVIWGVGDPGRPRTSQAANKKQTRQIATRKPWRIIAPF